MIARGRPNRNQNPAAPFRKASITSGATMNNSPSLNEVIEPYFIVFSVFLLGLIVGAAL